MKTLVDTYRGWEVYFDTDSEEFYTVSNQHDHEKTKRSYAACKTYVDEFIKDNVKFTPFWVEQIPSRYRNEPNRKITGIRKDGRYVYLNNKGENEQFSEYNLGDWMLIDDRNKPLFEELSKLESQRDSIDQAMDKLKKTFFVKTLKQVKEEAK